jgi:hypothetical protein
MRGLGASNPRGQEVAGSFLAPPRSRGYAEGEATHGQRAVPGLLTTYGPQRSHCSFAISSASSCWPRLRYLAFASRPWPLARSHDRGAEQ